MPTSPNNRAGRETDSIKPSTPPSATNSLDGSTGQNSHSKPQTLSHNQRRTLRQRLRATLAKVREDAQLAGAIDTVPQGAVEATNRLKEKVAETSQGEQEQPKLIEQAIKQGWAVPDNKKPELVKELVTIVERSDSDKTKVAAFRALLAADQQQHDRDNPQQKNKTAPVNVSVQTNITAVEVLRNAMKKVDNTVIPNTTPQDTPQITEE